MHESSSKKCFHLSSRSFDEGVVTPPYNDSFYLRNYCLYTQYQLLELKNNYSTTGENKPYR